jgi:hypothetical protein
MRAVVLLVVCFVRAGWFGAKSMNSETTVWFLEILVEDVTHTRVFLAPRDIS